ncbi:MAG: hypothetical protein KKD18_04905 [Nanoarchaeota archaeon]|nr:hypothetical protein [Nanoarchaeota archaeon]MBU0977730.1 hypothetical protein [Nanoarchaeota archaeon]
MSERKNSQAREQVTEMVSGRRGTIEGKSNGPGTDGKTNFYLLVRYGNRDYEEIPVDEETYFRTDVGGSECKSISAGIFPNAFRLLARPYNGLGNGRVN